MPNRISGPTVGNCEILISRFRDNGYYIHFPRGIIRVGNSFEITWSNGKQSIGVVFRIWDCADDRLERIEFELMSMSHNWKEVGF